MVRWQAIGFLQIKFFLSECKVSGLGLVKHVDCGDGLVLSFSSFASHFAHSFFLSGICCLAYTVDGWATITTEHLYLILPYFLFYYFINLTIIHYLLACLSVCTVD